MCGIVGYFQFKQGEQVDLEGATQKLQKRGPDAKGMWQESGVGLGHRRLSIIDTSEAANQPMEDVSGRYHLVFNGEIYNYRSIRSELKQQGVSFRTESDTEVLLAAFIHWREKCLTKLNGFFAFAVYDKSEESLFIARDRFGIKPLTYYQDESGFYFASELKALVTLRDKKFALNRPAIHGYFQLTYIPSPTTIYEDVSKLEPGHYLAISKNDQRSEKCYQVDARDNPQKLTFDQAKLVLRNRLEESVQRRLVADVPLGAYLSGGIDSSIISSLAKLHKDDLNTFSIGFKDNPYFDETQYAELMAKHIGSQHHTFRLSSDDLYEHLHDIVDYLDEPFADSSAIPVFILNKLTRDHVTVALSGDGADEVFSGYNKHEAWMMAQRKDFLNWTIRHFGGLLSGFHGSRQSSVADRLRKLNKYRNLLKKEGREQYWHLASFIDSGRVKRLLGVDHIDGFESLKNEWLAGYQPNSFNELLKQDVKMVLEGDMLRKVDAMSMANSLEVRVPFLDHELVDFAFSLPDHFKINRQSRKYILREAFRQDLPNELYQRGKHGFEVPLLGWFRGELLSQLDMTVFNRSLMEEIGIFSWSEVENIRKRLTSRNAGDVHIQVWQLYVFVKWWERNRSQLK